MRVTRVETVGRNVNRYHFDDGSYVDVNDAQLEALLACRRDQS